MSSVTLTNENVNLLSKGLQKDRAIPKIPPYANKLALIAFSVFLIFASENLKDSTSENSFFATTLIRIGYTIVISVFAANIFAKKPRPYIQSEVKKIEGDFQNHVSLIKIPNEEEIARLINCISLKESVRRHSCFYQSPLNDIEKHVLYAYTTNLFIEMNKVAEGSFHNLVNSLELTNINRINEITMIALSKLPPFPTSKPLRRRTTFSDTDVKDKFKPSTVIEINRFTSTTKSDYDVFYGEKVLFLIMGVSGRSIEDFSGIKDEEEVLFPIGTKFFVENAKPLRHGWKIHLREVPRSTPLTDNK